MAELDEAVADLEANIKELEAGIKTPTVNWMRRQNAGKTASDNLPTPPVSVPPPSPPGPPTPPPTP